jgi:hypothetical protein
MNETAMKKLYTLDEATSALPLVRAIVADIVRQFREISERKERLSQIEKSRSGKAVRPGDPYAEELAQVQSALEDEIAKLQEYIEELESLGVELKDLSRGLVDFRSLRDGREVYLCWHLGEEKIGYWHELEAGFNGRQELGSASGADSGADSDADSENEGNA